MSVMHTASHWPAVKLEAGIVFGLLEEMSRSTLLRWVQLALSPLMSL